MGYRFDVPHLFDAMAMAASVSNRNGQVFVRPSGGAEPDYVIGIDHGTIAIKVPFNRGELAEVPDGVIKSVPKETKLFLQSSLSVEARLALIEPFDERGEKEQARRTSIEFADLVNRLIEEIAAKAGTADLGYVAIRPAILRKLGKIGDERPMQFAFCSHNDQPPQESPVAVRSEFWQGIIMPYRWEV